MSPVYKKFKQVTRVFVNGGEISVLSFQISKSHSVLRPNFFARELPFCSIRAYYNSAFCEYIKYICWYSFYLICKQTASILLVNKPSFYSRRSNECHGFRLIITTVEDPFPIGSWSKGWLKLERSKERSSYKCKRSEDPRFRKMPPRITSDRYG